mmetsp:Transcript_26015/g.42674  ORF Transcript_26015/g.42674 Transcript_26015/m.42674 type:complete len:273 (+) Transcript_26015:218-1036(+)
MQIQRRSPFREDLLEGKVAFVTGGGSGICKGIAEAYLRHGAVCMIVSRNEERVAKAAAELTALTGRKCIYMACDVRKPEQVEAAIQKCLDELGRLDILVNGAAGNFLSPAGQLSYNAFRTVLEIDTMGTFNVSKAAYVKWLKKNGGVIINISMTLHYAGTPFQVHAAAAKAGVDAMTKHLSVEWGPNVRVNGLAPGPVKQTVGYSKLTPKGFSEKMEQTIPLRRSADVHEMADAALYLSSDASSYVTGTTLVVDGGSWMTANVAFLPLLSKL